MIVGDPSKFAIEHEMTQAYERLSFRALGFFRIHIAGIGYGVKAPDASLLANTFDSVERILAQRGHHHALYAEHPDPGAILHAYIQANYADAPDQENLGFPPSEFAAACESVEWAPRGGDEEFDDGSFVLLFDIDDAVRLIGGRQGAGYTCEPSSLSDLRIRADEFYFLLETWRDAFLAEWSSLPKILSD